MTITAPRTCIKCGKVRKDVQPERACPGCKSRRTYHAKPEVFRQRSRQRRKDPLELAKVRARCALYYAVKHGKINRQPCEICGDPKVHGHHDDYSKPLDVRWLCHPHHAAVHAGALR